MNGALIFDFDGLMLDTETPEMRIWQRLFTQAGGNFDIKGYQAIIGTYGSQLYQPAEELARLLDHGTTPEELWELVQSKSIEVINQEPALPGVVELIAKAKKVGLSLGVGSSSPRDWVHNHLQRLKLLDQFDTIVTIDDAHVSKPEPDIFLKVLENLSVPVEHALVLEDSYNGILAAQRAGIRAVAVPNPVTYDQDFSAAEEVLPSLTALQLEKYFSLA
jgi:HAD superfamily hydrolase (TIGR01509 family)